jgi:hypothetical protein
MNIYANQLALIKTKLSSVHEDLQYDYLRELESL